MKKAFTLIELLVVIAIIAILAAILFPVFAQAKAAAKQVVLLSNCKQMGTGTIIYTNDYDDTFPLAAVYRPDADGSNGQGSDIGTFLEYPFPADLIPSAGSPAGLWGTPGRENMGACMVSNSVQPYVKSVALEDDTNATAVNLNSETFSNGTPGKSGLEFNGDLHRFSTTAVNSSSLVPMWWPGTGNAETLGRAFSNPQLNCDGAHAPDTCIFNSGSTADSADAFYSSESTYGEDLLLAGLSASNSMWLFGNHRLPIVHCDSSAKATPAGTAVLPNYISGNGAFIDPLVAVTTTGQDFGFAGPGMAMCSDGQTPVPFAASGNKGYYSCFFRPDRVK